MNRDGELDTRFATRDQDSRRIAFEVSGEPDGYPVVLMHGTPGSRRGPKPRGIVLHRLGVRLITYDRPGYGDSPRTEGRDVADAARDVEAIVDTLGITRFAVAGRSGGGPHALACAADVRLRGRISRVAALVGFAPPGAADLDWYADMNADNRRGFGRTAADTTTVEREIRRRAELTIRHPSSLLAHLRAEMPQADRRAVNDAALRHLITDVYRDALRNGADGWVDDVLALRRDWKFDPRTIDTAVTPVKVWHGAEDTFAPASHARWLADEIDGAEIELQDGAAHFDAMEQLPRILRWLTADQISTGEDREPGARTGQRAMR